MSLPRLTLLRRLVADDESLRRRVARGARAQFDYALEPLRLFGPKHIACLMHDFALVQLKMGQKCARLGEQAVRASLQPRAAGAIWVPSAEVQRWTSELAQSPDPSELALRPIVREGQARAGYLSLYKDGELRLAAATREDQPPAAIQQRLSDLANRFTTVLTLRQSLHTDASEDVFDDETAVEDIKPSQLDADPPVTQFSDSVPPLHGGGEHFETQVLVMRRDDEVAPRRWGDLA